jgi:hypothetical protein
MRGDSAPVELWRNPVHTEKLIDRVDAVEPVHPWAGRIQRWDVPRSRPLEPMVVRKFRAVYGT